MGEIINTGSLGEVNGQVGDKVYSHIGQKRYVKQKGKKKNNHTKPREKTENRFGELSKIWSSMTIKEKKTWFKLLKSEHKFKNKENKEILDAKSLFISLNRNMQEIGEPINRTAPVYAEPQPMFNAKVEIISGASPKTNFSLTQTQPSIGVEKELKEFSEMPIKEEDFSMDLYLMNEINQDTKVLVFATPSITSPSDTVNERNYRYITVIDSSFVSGSSIKEEYLKVFKKPGGVGEEFSFKFKTVNKFSGIKGYAISCISSVISPKNQ